MIKEGKKKEKQLGGKTTISGKLWARGGKPGEENKKKGNLEVSLRAKKYTSWN